MLNHFVTTSAALLGLAALINGSIMLVAPEFWYWQVKGVAERGAYNQHFLRDIGLIYLLSGIAFVYGAIKPKHRPALWLVPSGWLLGHALFHLWEVLIGICDSASIWDDFYGVTIPALLATVLLYTSYRQQKISSLAETNPD
ncbi:hypothetical protein [Rheinheimera nanhaiensis]|uniref:Uncharacterized protein n=1 Tax=Rheinheimera nanhaiensis E407-8 TaxID=562729 RepID=I1DZG5_9GAMM|nr:hypothetical protein [Rheinheimera nanhaiensis]GAB59443.1 hypothetical protein RNAN_2446 [Rheinheimera nanhaiensis E407-8]